MNEHTEGKIEAYTEESFSGWFALRQITDDGLNHEIGSGDGGLFEPDARRLAAAWNACEGLTTENLESIVFVGETIRIRFDFINAELRQAQAELNAARALLREVVDMVSSEEYNDTIRKADAYLDAFDTLEGKC